MNSKKDMNVVFLGAGPTALAGIREIGEYGLKVFVVGLNRYETGLFSKYASSLGISDLNGHSAELLQLLEDFTINNKGINILIPTGDESVEFLSKNKERLSRNFMFHILENDVSDIFLNKENFYRLCQESKIPAPNTWTSNMGTSLNVWGDEVYYPCFIKPIYYHKWAKVYGLKKGFLVQNKKELLAMYEDVSKQVPELIVQEVIEGDDDQIVVFTADFDRDSNPRQIFTARKKRQYPNGFGTTTSAVSEDIEEIKEYAINILRHVRYRGVCDVEFKFDKRDKTYKIIEINPRIGRWYRLSTKSGKRPLLSSVLDLLRKDILLDETTQQNGVLWLFPIRDMLGIANSKNIQKINALKDYFGEKVWCVYDSDDKRPFFAYFMEMISKLYGYKR